MSSSYPEEDKSTWKTPCKSLSYGKLRSPDLYSLSNCLWASRGKSEKQEWKKRVRSEHLSCLWEKTNLHWCIYFGIKTTKNGSNTRIFKVARMWRKVCFFLLSFWNYFSKLPGPQHNGEFRKLLLASFYQVLQAYSVTLKPSILQCVFVCVCWQKTKHLEVVNDLTHGHTHALGNNKKEWGYM